MPWTLSSQVVGHVGERVTVKGWLHTVRSLGGVVFAVARDRAGLLQAVTEDRADADVLSGLDAESVVAVSGSAARSKAPAGELCNCVQTRQAGKAGTVCARRRRRTGARGGCLCISGSLLSRWPLAPR